MDNVLLMISKQSLLAYRAKTFCTTPGSRLASIDEAVEFVNQRGFIFFWPIKEMVMPSLWNAVVGDRPVPDNHDDPGHITWDWKDSMLGKRRWYYARILRKRNAMISLEMTPFFYALSENYGSPEEDFLIQYEQGRLTQEAKSVYEALLDEGPLDSIALRKAAHLSSRESDARFNKALGDLQGDMKILPVGISKAGAWNYAFIYDIVPRHFPDLEEKSRFISEKSAREKLAETFLYSVGAARATDLSRLFGWTADYAQNTAQSLVKSGRLLGQVQVEGEKHEYLAIPELR
ncbi:MAG TPA: crosslink repair DNA glycosylase YcaQ family protein [Anaerolineaceae bacterium]|nr:crosslink repair DNA glycosylase YcaQ family protein [Anaerolineaceae bacterium]